MKKMIFAAAIAQEKRNDMPTQGMNTLARERDYQAISERLSRMEPQQAARWLSLQEEELRFAVACKMQPQQAEQISVASRNRQHREATCTQGLLPWQKTESSG